MKSLITVTVMAEVLDGLAATAFANTLRCRLTAFGSIRTAETGRYWKIPAWFEVSFLVCPFTDPESAYNGILLSLGDGWERHDISKDEQWAVWNPGERAAFFSADARWANVERFPASAIVSP